MAMEMAVSDLFGQADNKTVREKIQALLDNSRHIHKAESIAELGRKTEVDLPIFCSTMERYNQACESGLEQEPEWGKPLKQSKKFGTPPFYAIHLFPVARKNFGGIKSDLRCHVLDCHFEPISGLYATGEVSGMAGGHINGHAGLEGTMLGPSIFSGRVAGAWAAQAAGFGPGFVGKSNRP